MATYTFSEFRLDEAEQLIDLESIRTDLQDVIWKIDYLLDLYKKDEISAYFQTDALATAILVRYGRAFASGVRRIDKERLLDYLPENVAESHSYFLDWRNRHIAHSVNDFEFARIQARYCLERVESEGITSVSVAQVRLVSPSSNEFSELRDTAQFFLDRLKPMINEEQERVLKLIRNLPIQDVIDRDEPAIVVKPERAQASKSRKRK